LKTTLTKALYVDCRSRQGRLQNIQGDLQLNEINGQKVILVGFSTGRQMVDMSLFVVVFLKKVPRSMQLQESLQLESLRQFLSCSWSMVGNAIHLSSCNFGTF
jgi:hypothetical protein